jgi:hypothetical protein
VASKISAGPRLTPLQRIRKQRAEAQAPLADDLDMRHLDVPGRGSEWGSRAVQFRQLLLTSLDRAAAAAGSDIEGSRLEGGHSQTATVGWCVRLRAFAGWWPMPGLAWTVDAV